MTEESTVASVAPSVRAVAQRLRTFAAVLGALAIVIAAGPYVLDAYLVNTLIRAFHYALVALTVDILLGLCGHSDLWTGGILWHRRLRHRAGFCPYWIFTGDHRPCRCLGARRASVHRPVCRLAFLLPGINAALRFRGVARVSDRGDANHFFRWNLYRIEQWSGRLSGV